MFLVASVLGAGTVVAIVLFQVRQILDQIPELVAAWRRVRSALRSDDESTGSNGHGAGDATDEPPITLGAGEPGQRGPANGDGQPPSL